MLSPLTPLELLDRSVRVYPDRVAVTDAGVQYSYAELGMRTARLSAALQRIGVERGDRVAVLCPNELPALECHFGPMRIGAILVMLNTRLAPAELVWILNHCEAKALIADPCLAPVLEPLRGSLPHLRHLITDYEALLATGDASAAAVEPDENDLVAINYTSGTTGFPKGVMFTHRGAYLNALGEMLEHRLDSRSVYLWTLPLFHCNGWCFPWAVAGAGGRQVLLRQVDPALAVELIERESVTHLCGAPVVVATLAQYCAGKGVRFADRLKIVTAGAPPTPAVIRAAEEIGADIAHVYGLTETYGPHTICAWKNEWDGEAPDRRARIKARQGVPYIVAGTGLRVVDREMRDVPADGQTMGEVVMRGNNVMLGYYKNPRATEEAFYGGWFHSGDLAVVHQDGYIELRDRAKDIVISGGENISSIEVEKALADHPAVAEAAIVAWPDEKWGEVPKAYVGLKAGMTATEEELIAWCRDRLSHFKCPKHVEFTTLPRTATGKIRKNELRERARRTGL